MAKAYTIPNGEKITVILTPETAKLLREHAEKKGDLSRIVEDALKKVLVSSLPSSQA